MDYTTKQLAIMGLLFLLGLVIGLMLRGGNRRLKQTLAEERAAHAAALKARDDELREIRTRQIRARAEAGPVATAP